MNRLQIVVLGVLPVLLERSLSHAVELVNPKKLSDWEERPGAKLAKSLESWQEKPNRRAGFASARRQAKKRRNHG